MKRALVLSLLLLFPVTAPAQDPATGFPPYGSFAAGGFDAVNHQNLNANFAIPIASIPGRGISFNFAISYNSLVWRRAGLTWQPVINNSGFTFGWQTDLPKGFVKYTVQLMVCPGGPGPDPGANDEYSNRFSNFSYTDPDGTIHAFPITYHDEATRCNFNTGPTSAFASDGSGYWFDANTWDVRDASGQHITDGGGVAARDTNGNFISRINVGPSETHWKDTLGRIVMKVVKVSNTLTEYRILDQNGLYTRIFKLYSANISIKTKFLCSGISDYTGSAYLPTALELPSGRSYVFEYEDTDTVNWPGYKTGRIKKVVLPIGNAANGYIEYSYAGVSMGINCADGTLHSLDRTVSAGESTPPIWTYRRTLNGSQWKTAVTAPKLPYDSVGNVATYTFTGNQLLSEKHYQGSETAANLRRAVNVTWAANGTPASRTTILEDAAATQSRIETVSDTNGNLTEMTEYAWGQGAPGSAQRYTKFTYLSSTDYTSRKILNRVTQVQVREGGSGGPLKSQTDVAYDESAYSNQGCPTGVTQHDDTNYHCTFAFRGNPTTVTRYADVSSPSSAVAHHTSYDWFGNATQADVNCCQQKKAVYPGSGDADYNFYGYPTQIKHGPDGSSQLLTKAVYNFHTGLATAASDANDQPVTFSYEAVMNRVQSIQRPDTTQPTVTTTYTYNDIDREVTVESPIDGNTKIRQVSYFDTLDRLYMTKVSDTNGAKCSATRVEYDPLGRAYRQSHPFACGGSPSNWTETQFDALGRVTLTQFLNGTYGVVPGHATTYSYSANTATVADPTGKQRKNETDALGRLVKVYEPTGDSPGIPGTGSATTSGNLQSTSGSSATPGTGSSTVNGSLQSIPGSSGAPGTGSATVSGSLQSIPGSGGAPGTGSVTISGFVRSITDPECTGPRGSCPRIYDSGGVSVTVNGFVATAWYGQGTTAASIATALANFFNTNGASPVTANASSTTVNVTAKANGVATNYPLSAASWSNDPETFPFQSFSASPSGSTLTGGVNPGPETYDSGNVWISVNGFQALVNYGQGSTSASIAGAIANIFNTNGSSPVTASLSGSTLSLTAKTNGASTNYSLSAGSSTSQPGSFSQSSFPVSVSGANLTGGANATPTVYDSGSVWVTVNGFQALTSYSQGSTSATVASAIANVLNTNGSSPVTASVSASTVTLTAKSSGATTNYSLASGSSTSQPGSFSQPSFAVSVSASTLSGGTDAVPPITDSGSVWVTVDGFQAQVNYGAGSNSGSVASALANLFNTSGMSPVTASLSGSVITLTAKSSGASTNYSLSSGSSTNYPGTFSQTSFSTSLSGSNLTGGTDPSPGGFANPLVTSYAYNVLDLLTTVTQGDQARTYTYDDMGRLSTVAVPETKHQGQQHSYGYQYNAFNLVTQRTDARGVVTTYTYDTMNRLQSVSYDVGGTGVPSTATVIYEYGDSIASNGRGRLKKITKGSAPSEISDEYAHDILGRVTLVTRKIEGVTYTIGYEYSSVGRIKKITYPSSRQVINELDNIGRLLKTSSGGVDHVKDFAYNDATGQINQFRYGNGVTADFAYGAERFQMQSIKYTQSVQSSPFLHLNYCYWANCSTQSGGNNGQITRIVDNVQPGRTIEYSYDALHRVRSAVSEGSAGFPKWGLSWTYDRYGNRTNQTQTHGNPPYGSFAMDASTNRLAEAWAQYDRNGNMLNDGLNTAAYDAANRQIRINSSEPTYLYDGADMRVKKCSPNCTNPSSTTVYIVSGSQVIAEYDNGAAVASPSREYIYAGSRLAARIEAGTTTYLHPDHLSVRATSDGAPASATYGEKNGERGHYPFGESWYESGSGSTKYKFTSYERDSESGNDYAVFRMYASRLGRFCSPDQIAGDVTDPQSLNRYAYSLNDPVNLADPLGLCPVIVAGIRQNPFDPNNDGAQALIQFAADIGAHIVFPYAEGGGFGSIVNQARGFPNEATRSTASGLTHATFDPSGLTAVITFSGGAQSYDTAMSNSSHLQVPNTTVFMQPGTFFTQLRDVSGQTRFVLRGNGFKERLLGWAAGERGIPKIRINCAHDAACAIRELRAKLGQLNFGPKCQDPLVISAGGLELPLVDVQNFINSLGGGGGGSDGGNDVGGFGGGSSGGHWEFHDFDGAGGHPGAWVYVCESGYVDWDDNGCENEN